ncbi:MAG TPA: bifunctional DNA primase/polymerase [Dehalococcoidia bacterium]|nr:bifunctional DNA primase/polymerase [Dehalococcoidia bacterium]
MADNPVRTAALAAYDAGLCPIRPSLDGSKAPLGKWAEYQKERPTRGLIAQWYTNGYPALGTVTGKVAGNLEAFEFDDKASRYEPFKEAAQAAWLGNLVERIEAGYLERSPSRGIHWLYRCPDLKELDGNTKLARRLKRPEEKTHDKDNYQVLIETRGEGGFIILAPSHGPVHPTGKPYELLRGRFATIATITPEERRELWRLARTFDEVPLGHDEHEVKPPASTPGGRPGDDFNARAAWRDILEPHGWVLIYEREGIDYWRRPGKDRGISATTDYQASGLLYVFSTSTAFESERGYSKFAAYALLKHGGDFKAAAHDLAGRGYGNSATPRRCFSGGQWVKAMSV